MSQNNVDITGLDKLVLLKNLWNKAITAGLFFSSPTRSPIFDEKEAKEALENNFIDYISGRPIKVQIWKNCVDPTLYDSYNGEGSFSSVIQDMRKGVDTQDIGTKFEESIEKTDSGFKLVKLCKFRPFGKELMHGNSSTVMCSKCGHFRTSHYE